MTDVRKFKFPPKTQLQQKERTKAVAWATEKVGGWRGNNVTASLQRYLAEAGYKVDQARIKRSMEYLVQHDLAIAVVKGRRTVEFILAPDVELEEPDFVRAQRVRAASHGPHPESAPSTVTSNGVEAREPRTPRPAPRLPRTRRAPDRLDELLAGLREWYRQDPEECDRWIADVLHDLET